MLLTKKSVGLEVDWLRQIEQHQSTREVVLELPRVKVPSSTLDSHGPLSDLGMASAFGSNADFSGIDGTHALRLSFIKQVVSLTMDEVGAQATAATRGTAVAKVAERDTPVVFRVNRPYYFMIRYQHRLVLFAGLMTCPGCTSSR